MTSEDIIEILGGIRTHYNIFDEWDRSKYHALSMAIEALKSQKHGRWLKNGDKYCECSICHHEGNTSGADNYCWYCGAKMDGERRNDETD